VISYNPWRPPCLTVVSVLFHFVDFCRVPRFAWVQGGSAGPGRQEIRWQNRDHLVHQRGEVPQPRLLNHFPACAWAKILQPESLCVCGENLIGKKDQKVNHPPPFLQSHQVDSCSCRSGKLAPNMTSPKTRSRKIRRKKKAKKRLKCDWLFGTDQSEKPVQSTRKMAKNTLS